jgi:exopolyphosphatase/guanosine-5'-triphosphate,3'-diphosphate pyrophosphatase
VTAATEVTPGAEIGEPAVLGAIDIGTNSFHLVVARYVGDDGFEVLDREKETVRLGHGGRDMKEIDPAAMERGLACLTRFARIAESYGATVRAVATSATREAENGDLFIKRAADEAEISIEVISGVEEARLIHLGVLQAVPVFDRRVLVIDIGGGSTEMLLGQGTAALAARSFKLGAVRLTDRYFAGGRVRPKTVKTCRADIAAVISHFAPEIERHGFDISIVSSGTAETMARMIHAATGAEQLHTYNCFEFTADEVAAMVDVLCSHETADRRRAVPGLEAQRADIIVAGALILDTIARRFGVERLTFSENALREGVLLDTISRRRAATGATATLGHLRDVAGRSVRQLAARCDDDPVHSAHVAMLALRLFDDLAPLHGLDRSARDYLEAAALLANVGLVVSHSKHHLHSYYVIRNSELAGFTDAEIEIVALIARYHRKSRPKLSHEGYAALDKALQRAVRILAGILRIAIGLDRSYDQRVSDVSAAIDGRAVTVRVVAEGDIDLELHAANERRDLLSNELERSIVVVTP